MTWRCCATAGWARSSPRAYAPSTLGSFLRAFTFGHVRQLDAVAARFLLELAARTRLLTGSGPHDGIGAIPATGGYALLDVDDTIIEVHGHQKQGAGFGYSEGPRAQRDPGHPHHGRTRARHRRSAATQGLVRFPTGRGPTDRRRRQRRPGACSGVDQPILVRMDSAFFGGLRRRGRAGRRRRHVRHREAPPATIKTAIAGITEGAWTTIEYPDAIRDEATGAVDLPGRGRRDPVHRVRRAAEARTRSRAGSSCAASPTSTPTGRAQQAKGTLFDVWRFHAFFTTTDSGRARHRGRGPAPTGITRLSSRSTPT